MDTTLLDDPAFWSAPEPWVAGEFPVTAPGLTQLAGHVLFQTSGTSGSPKWVAVSKQALLISAAAVNAHLRVMPDSVWGLALPMNHVGGFGVVARAYEAACGFAKFKPRWDAHAFRDWCASSGVTHTSLVPTQVHDLVKAQLTAPATLAAVVVGGGPLDLHAGQAARDLGWPVLASYGMTEAASQIATQGLELLESPFQAGGIPLLPIWQAEVSGDDTLTITGPALFSGYLIDGVFTPRLGESFVTADRVLLEDRRITPLGRTDLFVKILGELVDPQAIESELCALSGGRLAAGSFAVIAIPDDRAGHVLVPFFEATVDRTIIDACLLEYVKHAAGHLRLQPAVVVGEFPRSGLGKLQRSALAAAYPSQR